MGKGIRNLIILGVIGWIAWAAIVPNGPGDRPGLVISNGPVRIEEVADNRPRGEFRKGLFGMGRSWYHHHPSHGPSHLEVIVTDSSCGPDATYDATEVRVMSGGAGTSSTMLISIWGPGPLTYVEIDPSGETKMNLDTTQGPARLTVGNSEEQLQTVRIGGSSCAFVPGAGTITINQKR